MISLSIGTATEIYGNASRCKITRHWVDHHALADVSRSLRALVQSLGGDAEDDYWRRTLGPMRRLAFACCSVPVPFADAAASIGIEWGMVQRQVRLCRQLFPDSHEVLASLVQTLERLSSESTSPLIGPLDELLRHSGSLCVMIRNSRMNGVAAAYFAGNPRLRNVRIVSPAQLRGAHACDVLATIGPCDWFPEYLFSAPRAATIHIISFRWIRDGWKPGPRFLHNQDKTGGGNQSHRIGTMPQVGGDSSTSSHTPPDVLPIDLLPPMPAFTRGAITGVDSPSGADETVPARLCHLSGSRAAFLPADEDATSLIIDTSGTGRASVRRVPTDELEPGHYLLLRTSGGGDFIAPLADRILGDLAAKRRAQQAEWKDRLISKATERFGLSRGAATSGNAGSG